MSAAGSPLVADVEVMCPTSADGSSTTRLLIEADEDLFHGHYPGFPIFPGVALIECAHRSVLATEPGPWHHRELASVESARFLSPAFPGDLLSMRIMRHPKSGDEPNGDRGDLCCDVAIRTRRAQAATVRLRYPPPEASPPPAALRPYPPTAAEPNGVTGLDVTSVLPHRYPMLLVDAVRACVPGQWLTAVKAVSRTDHWFARVPDPGDAARNAYPQVMAYPEVLLLESWCQAAGALATCAGPAASGLAASGLHGRVMLFGGLSDAQFHRPVLPGDLVEHQVRALRMLDDVAMFEGESLVDGAPVLTVGRVVIALRCASSLACAR